MVAHDVPSEFKDEELWLKYFPKRSFYILGITFGIAVALWKILSLMHIGVVGIVFGAMIMVFCTGTSMIPVNPNRYMEGAGLNYDKYILRRLYRMRKKNRVIYVKHYDVEVESLVSEERMQLYAGIGEESYAY